jgi:hypothetical protein
MGMDSMNALAALQALAAKSGTTAETKKTTETKDSFNDVLAKMQKEQDEWDELMDKVDIAQYKLALADSFWCDQADPKKYISSYYERHQGKVGMDALAKLSENISMLNHLNSLGVLKGSVSDMELTQLNRKFSAAYASMMAARSVGGYF